MISSILGSGSVALLRNKEGKKEMHFAGSSRNRGLPAPICRPGPFMELSYRLKNILCPFSVSIWETTDQGRHVGTPEVLFGFLCLGWASCLVEESRKSRKDMVCYRIRSREMKSIIKIL